MADAIPPRSSQFSLLDIVLLLAGWSFTFTVLTATSGPPREAVMMVAVVAAMTATGFAISYPLWRFWLKSRMTVVLVNHAGYLLIMLAFIVGTRDRLIAYVPIFLAGPLSFIRFSGQPDMGRLISQLAITVAITVCLVALMSAHPMRRNLIGATLTSLGVAMWYLAGMYGVLAQGP